MKGKGLLAALISVIFLAVVVLSVFYVFSVKQVNTLFYVSDLNHVDTEEIQSRFDEKLKKNIFTVKIEDAEEIIAEYPYAKLDGFEKVYPNKIEISVSERQATFSIKHGANNGYYLLDETGFVVEYGVNIIGGDYLEIVNLGIEEIAVGDYVKASDGAALNNLLEMTKAIDYSDNLVRVIIEEGIEQSDLILITRTGVKIEIIKWKEDGKAKIEEAWKDYENATDYQKSNLTINVTKLDNGKIQVIHVNDDE